ncbi:MAG TPA: tetratricopeptide repeat protein, partial [Isosphaeraceae bacterium]
QLDDRPLKYASEPSLRERARKWTRRHPCLAVAVPLGLVAAVLVAGLIGLAHRFGPMEAAAALRRLAEEDEAARVLLLDPAVDGARRAEGIATCRRALERYGVLESPSWPRSRLVRNLPAADRDELRARVGELLMLWARALARQTTDPDPARRAEGVRTALGLNRRAESCYAPGAAPRVLWVQRADLALRAGDAAEAQRARERATSTPVRSVAEFALLALDDPDADPGRDPVPALAEASRREPRDFALWMLLGQCQALRARFDEAENCFTVAILLRPESPWPYFHRGLAELEREEFDAARLDFDRVLRLRPDFASALVDRALARLGRGDDAGAIEDLTAALERGAEESRIYFIRARAREQRGDRAGARHDRAEGRRRTPGDEAGWIGRGLDRLGDDPRGALADFEEALALNPRSRPALQDKAAVLAEHLGRPEEAIRVLDRAVALDPDYVPARVGRGVLLARLGRRTEAHRDAEESRRRDASAGTTYRAACIYALTSTAEPSDGPLAVRLLESALTQDASWADVARTDPDLGALRARAEFGDLLRSFSAREPTGRGS